MKSPVNLLLAVCLLSSTALAQVNYAWWANPIAAKDLNLTGDQKSEIASIAEEYRERLAQQTQETSRAEAELEGVFNAEAIDWKRGEQAIAQLVKARGELTQHISRMTLRMRAVLTPEQWRTLQVRSNNGRGPGRPSVGAVPGRGKGRPPAPRSSRAPANGDSASGN
jgi:Spy/CpxP family protein refolding chaperone